MPLFNGASRIYHPLEVNFMCSCFNHAAVMLEESDQDYSSADLASCIIMLYQSGMRDQSHICLLAARLTHQRRMRRHAIELGQVANHNVHSERGPFAAS